jgi:hypothetical protein
MAFKATFISKVPSRNTLHFNQTEYGLAVARKAQQLLITYKEKLQYFYSELKDLTLTTEMVFEDEESYRNLMESLKNEFPDFDSRKLMYITTNDIETDIIETEI